MYFKNAIAYNFTKPFSLTQEDIQLLLEAQCFTPCNSMDISKSGWTPVMQGMKSLVHTVNGNALICLKTESKILPAAVVKQELEEKVYLIEQERGQKVGRKERLDLKEEITQKLLPKAFSKDTLLFAYIDYKNQRIIVDTNSPGKAEELLAYLRKSFGTLPILPFKPKIDFLITLTDWVKNDLTPEPLLLANNINLKALDLEGSKATLKNLDLKEEEVQLHISNGKYVEQVSMYWDNKISFNLTEDYFLKNIKFLDVIKEQNEDINTDDKLAKFDADFALMSGELNKLIHNFNTWR